MSEPVEFEVSSGNVFADLNLPCADELLEIADLRHLIAALTAERDAARAERDGALAMRAALETQTAWLRGLLGRARRYPGHRWLQCDSGECHACHLDRDIDTAITASGEQQP